MKIEFDEETFLEDDDVWSTLFVKINGGDWIMAQPRWGTEDRQEIIKIIHRHYNKQLLKYVTFIILTFIILTLLLNVIISIIE